MVEFSFVLCGEISHCINVLLLLLGGARNHPVRLTCVAHRELALLDGLAVTLHMLENVPVDAHIFEALCCDAESRVILEIDRLVKVTGEVNRALQIKIVSILIGQRYVTMLP